MSHQKEQIISLFKDCKNIEAVYNKIIEIGQSASKKPFPKQAQRHLVEGCQSQLFLGCEMHEGRLEYFVESDALISSGLAQLLVLFYSQRSAEFVLKNPPEFLTELKIPSALTPSRANGLYHIHLSMKKLALEKLMASA